MEFVKMDTLLRGDCTAHQVNNGTIAMLIK